MRTSRRRVPPLVASSQNPWKERSTAYPVVLTRAALAAIEPRFVPGLPYVRAGVMLIGLEEAGAQPRLEEFTTTHEARDIGTLLGKVRSKCGTTSIGLGHGGIGTKPEWSMKRGHMSPRYTTEWDELLVVKAS